MVYKINDCNYDIKKFIKGILLNDFDIQNWNDWENWLENQNYEELQNEPNILASVEDNGILIGICGVKIIDTTECYLNSFYVLNQYRNNGIGNKLLDICINYIRRKK